MSEDGNRSQAIRSSAATRARAGQRDGHPATLSAKSKPAATVTPYSNLSEKSTNWNFEATPATSISSVTVKSANSQFCPIPITESMAPVRPGIF